jgi:hypothetical protein
MKQLDLSNYNRLLSFIQQFEDLGYNFRLVRDIGRDELHIAVLDKDKERKFAFQLSPFIDEKIIIKKFNIPYMEVRFMNEWELIRKEIK